MLLVLRENIKTLCLHIKNRSIHTVSLFTGNPNYSKLYSNIYNSQKIRLHSLFIIHIIDMLIRMYYRRLASKAFCALIYLLQNTTCRDLKLSWFSLISIKNTKVNRRKKKSFWNFEKTENYELYFRPFFIN